MGHGFAGLDSSFDPRLSLLFLGRYRESEPIVSIEFNTENQLT